MIWITGIDAPISRCRPNSALKAHGVCDRSSVRFRCLKPAINGDANQAAVNHALQSGQQNSPFPGGRSFPFGHIGDLGERRHHRKEPAEKVIGTFAARSVSSFQRKTRWDGAGRSSRCLYSVSRETFFRPPDTAETAAGLSTDPAIRTSLLSGDMPATAPGKRRHNTYRSREDLI